VATPARLAGVGAFVLGGLLLFTVGLFMIGDRQMAFAKTFTVYTEFKNITGLQPGAIVRVSEKPPNTDGELAYDKKILLKQGSPTDFYVGIKFSAENAVTARKMSALQEWFTSPQYQALRSRR
jgi:hypothetical protein